MDEMELFEYRGWQFLCSGERLPSDQYQATARYKAPPDNQIQTLVLDPEKLDTAARALLRAKEIAISWAQDKGPDGRGSE